MEKVCVILGAGASYDVYNGSAYIINADFQPPLACELFDMEGHPRYKEEIRRYSGAQYLASSLVSKAKANEFNLEKELLHLAKDSSPEIREHFKYIPPYLRDLLLKASTQYVSTPDCYNVLVKELLAEVPHEILLLVLNYDTLLEQALSGLDGNTYQFQNIDNYVAPGRQAKVVKLHGSINWFRAIGTLGGKGWEYFVKSLDPFERPADNQIRVIARQEPTSSIMEDKNWWYPVLTAPLAGKGITDMVCPSSHVKAAKEFLKDCRKFLIIGTSGLDEDLLSLLSLAVSPQENMYLHIVGGDQKQAEETLKRFQRRVRAFDNTKNMLRGSVYDSARAIHLGFKKYVSSPAIEDFAKGA